MRAPDIADLYGVMHYVRVVGLFVGLLAARPGLAAGAARQGAGWPPEPALFAATGTAVAPGLAVGDVLDRSNAARAAGLLPPEVLRHYENGDYRNAIASWPDGIMRRSPTFDAASAANVGRYALDPTTGTVVEAATGAPAADIYGLPFKEIDPSDPDGGLKAVWNEFHSTWNAGAHHINFTIIWVRPQGLDRQATMESFFQFYDNQEPAYRIPNPQQYTAQSRTAVTAPADLQGTVSLSYRYRDPERHDSLWTYVPSLRRVRVISASNRSDGMLGTDISLDDAHFFDAKPEDFTWQTVGLREGLRLANPNSIRGENPSPRWTGNGWAPIADGSLAVAGFQAPDWRGSAWAPLTAVLVKRRFWVVEAVPRDPDYLFGRLELWIDAESWLGAWSRKFSWKGEIAATYQLVGEVPSPASGPAGMAPEWVTSEATPWACMEAVPLGRATLAGMHTSPNQAQEFRTRLPVEELFSLAALTHQGR